MRSIGLVIALAASLPWLGGCVGFSSTERSFWNPDTWSNRAWKDDPVEFDVPGAVGLDLQNFNGDVILSCDPHLSKARLTIVREATHGITRLGEARDSLAEIDYTFRIVETDTGPLLELNVWTVHHEPHFQRAHVHLDLPSVDHARVRTTRGRVVVNNMFGALDIETSQGDVRILTDRPMVRPVRIVNLEGDIDYRVPGGSSATFDCDAVKGTVDYRVTEGRIIIHTGTNDSSLRATLNQGTNPVVLRTVEGDIRIAVIANPTEVGASIVTP